MKLYQEEIKNLRKEKNLTQDEFSKMTGIPKRTLQDWEEGKHKPKEYIINMLKVIMSKI